MFTGIVETLGRVRGITRVSGARRLTIEARLPTLSLGESIAVNGVCLTVSRKGRGSFQAEVSPESVRRTALDGLRVGSKVNLERALRADGRLGGHIVQGHVDGVGKVVRIEPEANAWMYTFEAPAAVARYLVEKGSVAVDGVSLTVAGLRGRRFKVAIIPHTASNTTLGDREPGEPVNLEADVLAKYVEKLAGVAGRARRRKTSPSRARRGPAGKRR
ncbi:MAG: riboflavin synthase [Deltaproteobacteria bacterium]|nr:riboflavin synthase [Deltaproteobacteria bacterium]